MRRIAIACEKGGVGKTTLAVGLSCALAENGRRVLLIDTDSQAAATRWLGLDHLPGLTRSFAGIVPLERLVLATEHKRIDLIPASNSLSTLERVLDGQPRASLLFRDALDALPANNWDYVIIDTPPTLGIVVTAVLAAVSEVIVPVEARPMGVPGMTRILSTAARVTRQYNHSLAEPRLVISRANHTGISRSVEADVRKRFGARVFETSIPERVAVAISAGLRVPVSVYEPHGPMARTYRVLAAEVERFGRRPAAKQPLKPAESGARHP